MPGISLDGAIELPWGLGTEFPEQLFRVCQQIRTATDDIILDASRLHFIDPLGMATLRSLFEQIAPVKAIRIDFLSVDLTSYLARMDFFKDLDIDGVDLSNIGNRHDRGSSLLEITKVTEHHEADKVASQLAVALTGKLTHSDPNAPVSEGETRNDFDAYCGPIEYALKELLDNSLTHARREGRGDAAVWVACQFYPRRDLVRLAIVDNGCGFLATLRNHPELADKTHRGAIEAALRPRVSCNRGVLASILGSENQGIGLTTTAKIAEIAGGRVLVTSGDTIHDTHTKLSTVLEASAWAGVSVSFQCRRERLPEVSIFDILPQDPAQPIEDFEDDLLQFR